MFTYRVKRLSMRIRAIAFESLKGAGQTGCGEGGGRFSSQHPSACGPVAHYLKLHYLEAVGGSQYFSLQFA